MVLLAAPLVLLPTVAGVAGRPTIALVPEVSKRTDRESAKLGSVQTEDRLWLPSADDEKLWLQEIQWKKMKKQKTPDVEAYESKDILDTVCGCFFF